METGSIDLPDDLIHEILLKVPIKSMMRFKTVSKHWLRLIDSNSNPFAFRTQRNSTHFFVLRFLLDCNSQIFPISILRESKGDTITKRYPQIDLHKQLDQTPGLFVLFPAGYGIVALFKSIPNTDDFVYLWNQVTNQYNIVPRSPYYSTFIPILGFAAVLKCNDDAFCYKVGRVLQRSEHVSLSLELYSSETKSWKFISNFSTGLIPRKYDHVVHCINQCVNLNGKVHWIIPCIDDDDIYITVFDYETELFTRIKAPDVTRGNYYDKNRCLVTLFDDKFLCLQGRIQ